MSDLTLAGAAESAPASAAELAARIPVPTRLPERYDGEPLRHLSPSSYSLWVSCPEAWRRRYIKGEKPPPSGSMFLGSRVDDALSAYHRRILEHGDRLAVDQVLDIYRERWASRARRRAGQAGHRLGGRAHRGTGLRAGPPGRRAGDGGAHPAPRRSGRRPAKARVHDRARPGVDGALLPRPRDAEGGSGRRAVADGRRLQGQEHPDQPRTRPTRTRRPASTSPGAGSRTTRPASCASRRSPSPASGASRWPRRWSRPAGRPASCAACSPGWRWPPARSPPATSATGLTRPWGFADPTSWKCSARFCRALANVPWRSRAVAHSVAKAAEATGPAGAGPRRGAKVWRTPCLPGPAP